MKKCSEEQIVVLCSFSSTQNYSSELVGLAFSSRLALDNGCGVLTEHHSAAGISRCQIQQVHWEAEERSLWFDNWLPEETEFHGGR